MSVRQYASNAPGSRAAEWNSMQAPSGYVPGLGRGAAGFTTRSDIGPAGQAVNDDDRKGRGRGRGSGDPNKQQGGNDEADEHKEFDAFMGNDAGMFAGGVYDDDDKEADGIWEGVDNFMDERRRERREKRLKEEIEKFRAENPKITEQFADLKRKLAEVTAAEWESIPDIGDYTVKKKAVQQFVPAPDSLLSRAAASSDLAKSVDGLATPLGGTTSTVRDLTEIGGGRSTVLGIKLDRMADSVTGQTVVDPKGYLTDLKSIRNMSDADIADIKKARLLLKSVIQTNPRHPPGWIAAARLEEVAGKLQEARKLVQQGCELCPKSEDVWLEASRLQTPENAKAVLARGVAHIPDSVKLWMAAARLEKSDEAQLRVLKKALERIPTSVRLWKAAIELVDADNAKLLLSRAVECCPNQVDLWLALAKLETYENAKKVLNRARQAIPTESKIWITAAMLEEANGNTAMVEKIIDRSLKALSGHGVVVSRDAWLKEAEDAERAGQVATCRAIVKSVAGLNIEDMDKEATWLADAEDALRKGHPHVARAFYDQALALFPGREHIWREAAQLEMGHGTPEQVEERLARGVKYCPQAEVLWLMAAKHKWKVCNDTDSARTILNEAFDANPDSEAIWLAAFKLEFESQEHARARALLAKARSTSGGNYPRVWMKSAIVERQLGNPKEERSLLEEASRRFPSFEKFYLMLGQLEEREGQRDKAGAVYRAGLARCPHSIPLWRSVARLHELAGDTARARALLEQARLKNPKNDELWLTAIRQEKRAGNDKAAEALLAKALQDCPTSGLLLAENITMAPRPARKTRSADALKRNDKDPHIIAAVALLFWADRKVDKARAWFERAVTTDPKIGDIWAQYYRFEAQHGGPEAAGRIAERCAAAEPNRGEHWCAVSKDPRHVHEKREAVLKKVALELSALQE